MTGIFLTVVNMSITAGIVALAVMLVRLPLKKAPKVYSYVLWAVVLFRLVCPFTIESALSLVPVNTNIIPGDIVYSQAPSIQSNIAPIDGALNALTNEAIPPINSEGSANRVSSLLGITAFVWLGGILVMLGYAVFSYIQLAVRLRSATRIKDNIFETDRITSPFVLGFIRPRIYLPSGIDNGQLEYIMEHERTHIRRRDYLVKSAAFLSLCLHWFNPVVWLSYYLMAKDMEMSCSESVLKRMGADIRTGYSGALLSLSEKRSGFLIPLAFGESSVKTRIKNILRYKKPAVWVAALSVVLVLCVVISCSTSRRAVEADKLMDGTAYSRKMDGEILNWRDNGCSYLLNEDGGIMLSYNDGGTVANAPVTLFQDVKMTPNMENTGFYISNKKTVIAYSGQEGSGPVVVVVSNDMGQTWDTADIDFNGVASWINIGFTSMDNGWVVISGFIGMGSEQHHIYKTLDGGKNWTPVKSDIDEVYGRMLSGAGFINEEIGFLCFRYETDFQPAVCITKDGGVTWHRLIIDLPDEHNAYSKTAFSPCYDGEKIIMPVLLSDDNGNVMTIFLVSGDYGDTWQEATELF